MIPINPFYALGGIVIAGLLVLLGIKHVQLVDARGALTTERAAWSDERTKAAQALVYQAEKHRKESAGWRSTQQENAREHQIAVDELLGQLATSRASSDRMRERANSLAALAGAASRDPGAQPGSTTAAEAANLLADMLRGYDEASREVELYADRAGGAGKLCERDYDALKPAPQP